MFIKKAKYAFAQTQVEYLGHIISGARVSTDPYKIAAITTWPQPANVRVLRGFLGHTSYCRRFVKNYGLISKPLTKLLKKDGFHWSKEAEKSLELLKKAE